MPLGSIARAAVILVVLAALPLHAAEQKRRIQLTQAGVEQKITFITNLINKSASSNTIENSGDPKARAALDEARGLIGKARTILAEGKLAEADETANAALLLVSSTTRKLSQPRTHVERLTKSLETRREAVVALLNAYGRVSEEKGLTDEAVRNRKKIQAYLARADDLRAKGKLEEARATLDAGYTLAVTLTRNLRQGETLVRELSFKTPKDEYAYELDRVESHLFLLEVTLKEKKPAANLMTRINGLRDEALALRRRATEEAARGDFKAGIATLGESTQRLIRAIRWGGNFIPG